MKMVDFISERELNRLHENGLISMHDFYTLIVLGQNILSISIFCGHYSIFATSVGYERLQIVQYVNTILLGKDATDRSWVYAFELDVRYVCYHYVFIEYEVDRSIMVL